MMFKIDLRNAKESFINSWICIAHDGFELHGFLNDSGFIYRYNQETDEWKDIEAGIVIDDSDLMGSDIISSSADLALFIKDPHIISDESFNEFDELIIESVDGEDYKTVILRVGDVVKDGTISVLNQLSEFAPIIVAIEDINGNISVPISIL